MAAPFLGIAEEMENPPAPSHSPVMLRFARRAMATQFEVILPFDADAAQEAAGAALDEVDRLEAQLTVYRDTSEVSLLNARAADHPVRVAANLFELLTLAARIHRETAGAFDVAVGSLIKAWGFYRREGRVPTPHEIAAARDRMGMHQVVLDAPRQTVEYRRQGVEINLGSIGKGYALDCAAQIAGSTDFLMHGGYSSIVARGPRAFPIGITDPEHPDARRALVHLCNRGMATSAATHQHFVHAGKKLGHILDPRTAWPAEGVLSATVTAPTAAEADAFATAFFILGVEKAEEYCASHPELGAALITAKKPHRIALLGRAAQEVEVLR